MSRQLHTFPGGLKLATFKHLSDSEMAQQQALPERLILPLQQHIGIPAEPVVRIGDQVLKGQVIARANGYVSLPVHASTSGRIIDIGDYPVPHPSGLNAPCIVIEADGLDQWGEITPTHEYASVDPQELQTVICECGISGLGGAGFPAHVKIREGVDNAVDTLIINGVECEPYITCDARLIQEKAQYVVAGTRMIGHAVQARHCVIAIEDDMPASYQALAELVGEDIELVTVPARYPAGGEKQLIQVITGKTVPSGGLPIHVGIVMHNVATAAAVYRAVTRGEPIISRYVTISGNVERPRNLQVLLGTPVKDCLANCGFTDDGRSKIILGGPMMGMRVRNPDIPITKTTNCILIQRHEPAPPALPCIRCGRCAEVCPVRLQPQQLYWHAESGNFRAAQSYHLFDCIECGLCAYVCPSHIPLVQYFRYAKSKVAETERRERGAEYSLTRFLEKNARAERLRADRARPLPPDTSQALAEKRSYIEAAVARSKQKKELLQKDQADDD
ncbi:MAG: Electron transport complex, RnfABCDGE type, C subunit [Gammaproteobacteria bacterium]|nr:Electron transport complex, RnfABCDGE type, C subunit [Gammaproteobacteria bacterium]